MSNQNNHDVPMEDRLCMTCRYYEGLCEWGIECCKIPCKCKRGKLVDWEPKRAETEAA
jgi:hypothetical protein